MVTFVYPVFKRADGDVAQSSKKKVINMIALLSIFCVVETGFIFFSKFFLPDLAGKRGDLKDSGDNKISI